MNLLSKLSPAESPFKIPQSLRDKITPLLEWYQNLSFREKGLIIGGIVILIPLSSYKMIVEPLQNALKAQSDELAQFEQDMKAIPHILDRYKRFKQRKDALEAEFREVDITEGEKTFLETILTGKVDPGFRINELGSPAFGEEYQQTSLSVKFSSTSLQNIVDILTGISTGKKRMLLTAVTVTKTRSADKLEALITASSIRAKAK